MNAMEQSTYPDEKIGLLEQTIKRDEAVMVHRKRPRFIVGLAAVFLLLCCSFNFWGQLVASDPPSHAAQEKDVDFADIVPSEKLEWHPCWSQLGRSDFKCARLTVPMDYNRPLNASIDNPKVHIALTLVPGKHTGSKKHSTSPLLLNPGGPGGPGATFALFAGPMLQKIVGADQDVIGFDPRGIGATTPRADCFSNPPWSGGEEDDLADGLLQRILWMISGNEVGNVNSSSDSLFKLDTRARTIAKLCQRKDSIHGKDSILRYVHTPSVARDMISIIDAWDEWTASESSSETLEERSSSETSESGDLDAKGKLSYWGFSYGTLLGATFASMFPSRVHRMVLDGVVDADHYVAPVWADSIRDADAIYNSFARYCHEAKHGCALYKDGDVVADIHNRLEGFQKRLRDNPITAVHPIGRSPFVFHESDLRMLIFSILYSPQQAFPALAMIVDLLDRGMHSVLAGFGLHLDTGVICRPPMPYYFYPTDASNAIMCSDKRYPLNETLPNLEDRFEQMSNLSSFADVWMTVMVGCDSWGIEAVDPPMRWDDHPAHKQKPIKTSFPLLFLSNTADPVTPLYAGVKMAQKFVDAGIVEQKSMGHCSLSAVSRCTTQKVAAYFTEGKVPPHPVKGGKGRELVDGNWDKCEADEWPFHPFDPRNPPTKGGEMTAAEVEAMTASKQMQEIFSKLKFWTQNSGLEIPADFFQEGRYES